MMMTVVLVSDWKRNMTSLIKEAQRKLSAAGSENGSLHSMDFSLQFSDT